MVLDCFMGCLKKILTGTSTRAFVKDYLNKQERFKISFLNGLKDGPFTFYHPDGKISLEKLRERS